MKRALLATLCMMALARAGSAERDLTFLHLSDVHAPHALGESRATVAAMPGAGPIRLAPYDVSVPGPAFALVTGDLTEYGASDGWERYMGLWSQVPYPVHHQLGNHDNTWDCCRPRLRAVEGSAFYAFEHSGIRFIGWDTATPQDPRPSIATEGLRWLAEELGGVPAQQPVIFFCHHPLDGNEFAGPYDRARLLDLLRTRNVVLLLVGHGHGARAWQVEGLDSVMGGTTYGDNAGFGIISVQGDTIRVCHRFLKGDRGMVPLLEKRIPARSPFLDLTGPEPGDGHVFGRGEKLEWKVTVAEPDSVRGGEWDVDGRARGNLEREGETWWARVPAASVGPGAHVLRLTFTRAEGPDTSRSVAFWKDGGACRIVWTAQLPGSCQSTPLPAAGKVFVGSNDGSLCAVDAGSGDVLWRVETGGEVRSGPVLSDDGSFVVFGSADGNLRAVGLDGTLRWSLPAGSPIYAPPRVIGDMVLCPTNGGEVLGVEAATGVVRWRARHAQYAIEAPPGVGDGAAFTGAWDRFVYALELADGALRWKQPSLGSEKENGAARYYSPADCAPAVVSGRVVVADRAYDLTTLDARTGARLGTAQKCAGVAAAPDGQAIYLRHTDGRVSKQGADGTLVWETKVPTGYLAIPPTVAKDRVWVVSDVGTVSILDEQTGALRAQYKAFAEQYVFSAPAVSAGRVYVADAAGVLLALELR